MCHFYPNTGGAGVQGHPWPQSEFEADLIYMRLCQTSPSQKQNPTPQALFIPQTLTPLTTWKEGTAAGHETTPDARTVQEKDGKPELCLTVISSP